LKEKLQVYALWAEILGGLAILVSLLFVGIQLKQSNDLATTDALREGTELWTDAYMTAFGTEESTAFFTKAINHCNDLSKSERGRFFAVLSKFVSAYDNIFNQYESGRLRQEVFISIASVYYSYASTVCGQRVLSQDFPLLPPYLLSPSEIEVLSGHDGEMKLPDFLVE
jgi:hypothetical protein